MDLITYKEYLTSDGKNLSIDDTFLNNIISNSVFYAYMIQKKYEENPDSSFTSESQVSELYHGKDLYDMLFRINGVWISRHILEELLPEYTVQLHISSDGSLDASQERKTIYRLYLIKNKELTKKRVIDE
jgi:hypothetical protein